MLPLPSSWRLHVLLILPVHCISCFAITFVCCPSVLKDDHRTYGPRWDANQATVPAYHRCVCSTTKLHALGRTANATGIYWVTARCVSNCAKLHCLGLCSSAAFPARGRSLLHQTMNLLLLLKVLVCLGCVFYGSFFVLSNRFSESLGYQIKHF